MLARSVDFRVAFTTGLDHKLVRIEAKKAPLIPIRAGTSDALGLRLGY